MSPSLLVMDNPIMHYAWGSPAAIPQLLGRKNPEGAPWAELWMGAHPRAPSSVNFRGASWQLNDLIARDPEAILGVAAMSEDPPHLPFLFKVLAADRPLSIQCHPDRAQARAGFAREERAGIPRDAPHRNYRDNNHKPELIVALTPFTALKGFRPVPQIRDGFSARIPAGVLPELQLLDQAEGGLVAFFSALMTLPPARRQGILAAALKGAAQDGWMHRLHQRYPGDIGVLAPLLLNLVTLQPGQGLFLRSGELHAYLEGLGLEVMASSDNVLRGGLTAKHIDVPELLQTLTFSPALPQVLSPEPISAVESLYATPAPEFALSVLSLAAGQDFIAPERRGVEILLMVSGEGTAECGGEVLPIQQGTALLAPATSGSFRLSGEGRVYRVRAGHR